MPTFIEQVMERHKQWAPITTFPVRVMLEQRSASAYDAALAQFDVEHSGRYRPRDRLTFCNIFAWDVTSAMYAEIPHWVTGPDQRPSWPASSARELRANQLKEPLDAGRWGWSPCSEAHAMVMAAAGHPAVVLWQNPDEEASGHIAMVEPLPRGPTLEVAQAGLVCGRHIPLANAFGGRDVGFYWHA